MFRITEKNQPMHVGALTVLIYGEAGIGKTTLCNTSNNAVVLDFDKGSHRASYRQDVLSIDKWSDIAFNMQDFLSALEKYDTIVIDTIGNMLDFMMLFILDENPRFLKNKMQAYGELKNMFYDFHQRLIQMNKDIVFIAHVKTKDEGDYKSVKPLASGSSYDLIVQKSDLVGYMSVINGKTILDFNASEFQVAKNCAGYEPFTIGNLSEIKDKLNSIIVETKSILQQASDAQKESLKLIDSLTNTATACIDADGLNELLNKLPKIKLSKSEKIQIWESVKLHGESLGLILDSNKQWIKS